MDDLGRGRAKCGVGSHNLSGVNGVVGPGGSTSHEGGGGGCDGGETHFDGYRVYLRGVIRVDCWRWRDLIREVVDCCLSGC